MVRLALLSLVLVSTPVLAETVDVKFRGPVPLDSFECPAIKNSSLVKRICFDDNKRYAVVSLKGAYYHYCGIGQNVIAEWVASPSLGRFYNQNIKVASNGGLYDCRQHPLPLFE